MKKQRLSATNLPKLAKKTPKNEDNRMHFFTKKGYFCVNECKNKNICHTILMLNPFI